MKIAVAGGTGVVGRHAVAAVTASGHEAVVLARSRGIDLVSGDGLAQALAGVSAVIDVANISSLRAGPSSRFFAAVARNLMSAGERAGAGHIVALSIIGIDRVPIGYYQGKLHQEEVLRASPVPVTVLRAAQFHEFPGQLLAQARGPVAIVPRFASQPVAAREVGAELARLAAAPPPHEPGAHRELAGPRAENVADLVRQVLRARGERRRVLEVTLPGKGGKAMAGGGALPGAGAALGTQAFADWLREHPDGTS
jgi:uncharacterized protein YbjT (DUF2867 family)